MEKVEVDLLNKDDDNYNREVLHSVKVPMMIKIMFLKGVFFKSNTHASYIMLQGFYGRNKDFLCSFPSGWDLFAEVQLQKHL